MEHLKAIFHEELADPEQENARVVDGVIYVRERRWAPGDLLQALGDPVYSDVFANWVVERRERLLERADEILDQFDQADRFEVLKSAFRRGTVVPFIGAGMSIPSGYPGWTDFLFRVRRHTSVAEHYLSSLLAHGEYERAAQELADALGVAFDEQVEAKFGLERPVRGPVQLVPYVFDTPVATTNFDDVLQRSYDARGKSFEQVVAGADADEIQRHLSAGRRVLLKLHGTATSVRGRVLTAREYDGAYGADRALDRVVRSICVRTLLFMGCRLTVDRLLTAIGAFVGSEGHNRVARHYAFLSAADDEATRREREAALARLNIYPIWYPEKTDNESIEALLYRLADGVVPL